MIRRGRGRPRKIPRVEEEKEDCRGGSPPPPPPAPPAPPPPPPPLLFENGSFPGPAPELEEEHENRGNNMFFKIIHSHIIRDRKLAIPMKFLRKFTKDLSDFAILKAPRGPTWRVELKKGHRGDVWFRNGWQGFIDYHSISPGDFLIFRYDGNSQFHVLIFDPTGSEIDYLSSSTSGTTPNHDIGVSVVTVKKEIIEQEEEKEYMGCISPIIDESSVKPKSSIINPVYRKKYARKALDVSALEAASQFKSEHPFFTIQMKPSYVNHKFVPVLSTFDKSLMPGDRGWIKIRGSNGQKWYVGILASENKKEYRLSKGISAFISDNDLKEGDVCVFELIKEDDDLMLNAHTFHQ